MPRVAPRKIVLPEGELRRFRLPEAFDHDQPEPDRRSLSKIFILAVWVTFSAFCFGLSQWRLPPTAWLGQVETDSAAAVAVLSPQVVKSVVAAVPAGAAAISPRRAATTLKPVLELPSVLPAHGGGVRRDRETLAFIGDHERTTAPRAAAVLDISPASEPQLRANRASRPSELRDEASPFQEDLQPERGGFDSSPVRLNHGPLFDEPGKALLSRSHIHLPEGAPEAPPQRSAVEEPVAKGGTAHTGGGCERAFETAERRIDVASETPQDVSREVYAQKLEKFSNYAHCGVPDDLNLSVCAAVHLGRVRGVTVTTEPARPAVARCVARVVQGFSFPSSANPDLVRTEFTSQ